MQFLHQVLQMQGRDPRFALQRGFAIVRKENDITSGRLVENEKIRLYTATQVAKGVLSSVESHTLFPDLDEACARQRSWLQALYDENK